MLRRYGSTLTISLLPYILLPSLTFTYVLPYYLSTLRTKHVCTTCLYESLRSHCYLPFILEGTDGWIDPFPLTSGVSLLPALKTWFPI